MENLEGSCLCGSVAYRISGEALHFYHCHCSRCRKASGTGHASNIIMRPAEIHWTRGEDAVGDFKIADAKYFNHVFCKHCGSSLPRYSAERGVAVVPAGSLDNAPEIQPEARIFKGSAAAWSCDATALPEFETYPPA